ncbi:antibiotic biosynthesis monooxygenase family protein [Pseudogemmobacter sonorensis]|uniref:antibiotic biosynthesis monooxygenase family protein n=1 Tax=Pseudogemmobacter sonorensis TaxID=2989681 RepID=UPI00367B84AE
MYLTMNRFKVKPGQEAAFEAVWKDRDSHLLKMPGFVSFDLFKGPVVDGLQLYASHAMWQDEASFRNWTKSEAFRDSHKGGASMKEVLAGPPQLEIFESVQSLKITA